MSGMLYYTEVKYSILSLKWKANQPCKKGILHPNQKLAYVVLYLKIINTFLKNNTCIL